MKLPPIKFSLLFLCGILLAAGCKEKSRQTEPAVEPTGTKLTPPPAATIADPTKEQKSSTIRVQVVAGAIPPRNYTGALLHSDDLADVPGLQGKNRCVLALLTGWTGEQLRNPACRLSIFCNPTGAQSNTNLLKYPGRLVQFDEKTGLAVITYIDGFDAGSNAGYRLAKDASHLDGATVIRTKLTSAPPDRPASQPARLQPEIGSFSLKSGNVQFTAELPEASHDESPVALGEKGALIGFLSITEETAVAKLVSVSDFKLDLKVPRLKLLGIGFGKADGGQIPILIKTEPEDPKMAPKSATLAKTLSPGVKVEVVEDRPVYAPIQSSNNPLLTSVNSREWRDSLVTPQTDGQEFEYSLQLGWNASGSGVTPDIFSKPFVVKLANHGGSVVATVSGLQNLTQEPAAPQATAASFALETTVHDFHEIAGGREVLLQLDGAPFWKRFSMAGKEWLPLPPVDLSNAYVTGNLSFLFILNRGTGELRKYRLPDLTQIAEAKLAPGEPFVAVLAGCNTDRAPVHVLTTTSSITLSPDSLQPLQLITPGKKGPASSQFRASVESNFHITGDGLSFRPYGGKLQPVAGMHLVSNVTGARTGYFDTGLMWWAGSPGAGVSAAYIRESGFWLTTVATPDGTVSRIKKTPSKSMQPPSWLAPNSPTILQFVAGDPAAVPVQSDRIECYSYNDAAPFATVEVPEWSGVTGQSDELEKQRCLAFDPYSLRLGVISWDRKKWNVHAIVPVPGRNQPVLLNWPDSTLARGSELRFKPAILGGQNFSTELLGAQASPAPKTVDGQVTLSADKDELSSLQMLKIKLPGQEGGLSYSIPIHLLGPQLPMVASPDVDTKIIDAVGAGFKSLETPKDAYHTIRSTIHSFNDPVREVFGPLSGHLVLVTEAGHVDFLSVTTGKVTKSIPAAATARFFPGAQALFEYDTSARALARISVPAGQRERVIKLPGNLQLHGIGVGTSPDSPLTLLLEQVQRRESEQFGDLTLTWTESSRDVVVLDNHTLNAAGWPQPKKVNTAEVPFNRNGYFTGEQLPSVVTLPASHDGRFVTLPVLFLALNRGNSYAVPLAKSSSTLYFGKQQPQGSISGIVVSNGRGEAITGAVSDDYSQKVHYHCTVTPCGRYRLVTNFGRSTHDSHIEVRTVENDRLLFHISRLNLNQKDFSTPADKILWRLIPLGDNGPLVVLAGGGKQMEVIDCDIPRIAQIVNPASFHVISQCPPSVIVGAILDYQIQVSNPEAVSAYKLREPVPGVALTPNGFLQFTAPPVTNTTRVQLTVEVHGKDGSTVLHEFPIFVVPAPPSAPGPGGKGTSI